MPQPVYILKNGQRVSYVPIEIKDHREAYAATLHVLFKHVADFHICVVQAFSKKYGIPEDEIMQTIQESEEFKNMHVDPVLHDDGLGYFSQDATAAAVVQPDQPDAAVVQPDQPDATVVQPDQPDAAVVQPDQPDATVVQPDTAVVQPDATVVQPDIAIVTKKRIVRKKAQVTPTSEKVITTDEANQTPQITMSQTPEAPPGIVEKKKIIRKKVGAAAAAATTTTVELDRNGDDIQPATAPTALHSDALVQLLTKDTTSSAQPRKKIIRKKA
jgi:hypothetical protein